MHELSIARAVVAEVEEAARLHVPTPSARHAEHRPAGRRRARCVDVRVRTRSEGTMLEGAELIIEIEPTIVWCPDGEHPVDSPTSVLRCDVHGCATPELLSGKQLEIVRFEPSIRPVPTRGNGRWPRHDRLRCGPNVLARHDDVAAALRERFVAEAAPTSSTWCRARGPARRRCSRRCCRR